MRIFPLSMLKGLSIAYKNTPDKVNGFFLEAVKVGDIRAVNKIISIPGFDVNKPKDFFGHTALPTAAFGGSHKIVQALINKGADLKTQGIEALHSAISGSVFEDVENNNIGIIELLLKHGVDINGGVIVHGFTPLMGAAIQGKKELIELLLSKGANPNLTDNEGHTALDLIKKGRARGNMIQELTDLLTTAMKKN